MVADPASSALPVYLVVTRHGVVAADIAATITELDTTATVVVALSPAEAADRLAGLDRVVLAVVEGAPHLLAATPFGRRLAERRIRVLVLDDSMEAAVRWSDVPVLALPFTTGLLLAALRRALA